MADNKMERTIICDGQPLGERAIADRVLKIFQPDDYEFPIGISAPYGDDLAGKYVSPSRYRYRPVKTSDDVADARLSQYYPAAYQEDFCAAVARQVCLNIALYIQTGAPALSELTSKDLDALIRKALTEWTKRYYEKGFRYTTWKNQAVAIQESHPWLVTSGTPKQYAHDLLHIKDTRAKELAHTRTSELGAAVESGVLEALAQIDSRLKLLAEQAAKEKSLSPSATPTPQPSESALLIQKLDVLNQRIKFFVPNTFWGALAKASHPYYLKRDELMLSKKLDGSDYVEYFHDIEYAIGFVIKYANGLSDEQVKEFYEDILTILGEYTEINSSEKAILYGRIYGEMPKPEPENTQSNALVLMGRPSATSPRLPRAPHPRQLNTPPVFHFGIGNMSELTWDSPAYATCPVP